MTHPEPTPESVERRQFTEYELSALLNEAWTPDDVFVDDGEVWDMLAARVFAASPLAATPQTDRGDGVTTQCPQIGVHDHPFRGPHTFTESYADAIASPSEEPGRPPLDPVVKAHDDAYMAGLIRGREVEREAVRHGDRS
jgi:hypothetical protein